jgi:dipeptidase E
MKLYLSSYKVGDEPEKLTILFSDNKSVGYVPNALDFTKADAERRMIHVEKDMQSLEQIGLHPVLLDLKEYFLKKETLKTRLSELGGLFISGGNTFVLRQAMKLSGLDSILTNSEVPEKFVYAGYSAAGCVLSPTLKSYSIVDDATDHPYEEQRETIWEGLGLIDFAFMPHHNSDHQESDNIQKEVAYCEEHGIPYKTLRDGEAIVI